MKRSELQELVNDPETSTIELVSAITDFNDLSEHMNDEYLDRAMALVVKLIAKPDIPPAAAPKIIVELQALSAKMAISMALYKTFSRDKAGTTSNYKKETYYTIREALDRVVDSLKYVARYGPQ